MSIESGEDDNFFDNAETFKSLIARSLAVNQSDSAKEIKTKLDLARKNYPEHLRQSLDGKLRDFNKFRGAVWELYFWDSLVSSGVEVSVESRSGVGLKTIDFSWESPSGEIWLEVTSRSISQKEQKIREAQDGFYAEMASELRIHDRFIIISIYSVTEIRPEIESIARKIEKLFLEVAPPNFRRRFDIEDSFSGWKISVEFGSRMNKEIAYTPLMLEPLESDDLDFSDYREALLEKFKKFSDTQSRINLVALVGSHITPPSAFEAVRILYGTPSLRISINEESSENVLTDLSFFSWGNEAFSYIFAVILGFGYVPGFSSLVEPIICLNPNSCHEFDPKLIPLEAQVIRLTTSGFEQFDRESKWIPLNIFG